MMEGLHYLLTACTYLFIAFVSYGIYLCFYRLFFHPLAKFPGPKLAAATYWYECYADLIIGPFPGQGAYHIERLHKRYGEYGKITDAKCWPTRLQQVLSFASVQTNFLYLTPNGLKFSTNKVAETNGPRTRTRTALPDLVG